MHRRISLLPLFVASLAYRLAADTGGGSGSGTEKPTTLSAAQSRIDALEKGLTERDEKISAATKERDEARKELATANATIGTLTTERDQARTDLAAANTQIATLTTERDTARTDLGKATANVDRLKKFCAVHGIDPEKATPTTVPDPAAEDDKRNQKAAQVWANQFKV